ncbi:MAG: FAD-binding oxidoreductase [Mycobacteriaceae bacterium]|nr:FAD-binding oxidoreductase [Mycobacteriaceae bacterium]
MAMSTTELTGDVVRRGDPRYEAARVGFNRLYSRYPEAIVFCRDTADVVNAVGWARKAGLAFRARSGRHCLEGWSAVDDGLVIDMSQMKSTEIDAASKTAILGAGLNQLEAVIALGEAGFAAPTGIEGTVGLVGATLGGGLGPLTRNYGMASDNLLAAEVVVASADGAATAIIADGENNSDLLWALRGAGNGNFGIVTSLTCKVHPLTQTIYLVAAWRGLNDLQEVFEAWQRTAPHLDYRLTSQLEIHRDEIRLFAVLACGSEAETTQMLEPILSIGQPHVTTKDANWADNYAGLQIPIDQEPANWKFFSQFISEPFPPDAIGLIGSLMARAPTSDCNYFTNAFGGAVKNSEPSGGSAFAHRDAIFYAEPGAGWGTRGEEVLAPDDPLTPECLTWIADFGEALRPYVNGAYPAVPNAGMLEWQTAYWGPNVEQLRTIKTKYDPDNVFNFDQSLPPSAGERGA